MYKEIYKAARVNNSHHYVIDGFTVPLMCPTIIYEIYTKSINPYIKIMDEDNASPVHRGDFYNLVSKELKSRSADIYKFSLSKLYPYFNKFLPVSVNKESTVMLAFAGDGTQRAWVYIENYTKNNK